MDTFFDRFYKAIGKTSSYIMIASITVVSLVSLLIVNANEFTFYSNILEQAGIIEKPYTASTPILRRDAFRIAVGIGGFPVGCEYPKVCNYGQILVDRGILHSSEAYESGYITRLESVYLLFRARNITPAGVISGFQDVDGYVPHEYSQYITRGKEIACIQDAPLFRPYDHATEGEYAKIAMCQPVMGSVGNVGSAGVGGATLSNNTVNNKTSSPVLGNTIASVSYGPYPTVSVSGLSAMDQYFYSFPSSTSPSYVSSVTTASPSNTDGLPEGSTNLYYTDARVMNVLSGTLPGIMGITGAVDTLSGQVNILSGQMVVFSGQLGALSGNLNILSGTVFNLSGQVFNNTTNIFNLSGIVNSLSGDLGVLSGVVNNNTTNIFNLSGVVNNLSGELNAVSGSLYTLSGNIAYLSGLIGTLSGGNHNPVSLGEPV